MEEWGAPRPAGQQTANPKAHGQFRNTCWPRSPLRATEGGTVVSDPDGGRSVAGIGGKRSKDERRASRLPLSCILQAEVVLSRAGVSLAQPCPWLEPASTICPKWLPKVFPPSATNSPKVGE